jgi:hypothetical protein
MSFLRRDEKKRLVAELVDELISRPAPMEQYSKFQNIDMVVTNGLIWGIMFALMTIRDIATAALLFTCIMAVIFVYTYFKSIKRQEAVMGKMFLDSTTYIGDSDILEQIEIEGWELLIAPKEHIDKSKLVYEDDDLLETLTALRTPGVRVGGGPINAPIVEELARVRADRYIDEHKQREAEKESPRVGFFKKRKPSSDLSRLEDEKDSIFEIIKGIDFELLGDEIDDGA